MSQPRETFEHAQEAPEAYVQSIPWEVTPTAVDSGEKIPPRGSRISNRYKDRYGRLHDLENGVSYFIDPEDGIPKKVITQRSTKLDTVVGAAQSHYGTTGEAVKDTGTFLATKDSWVVLAVSAIRDRWSRDKDPPLPKDLQQLVQTSRATSFGHFNATWDRTRMKNKSSLAMQLIYWIYAGVPPELISPQAANDEEDGSHITAVTSSNREIKTWVDLWRYDRNTCWWLVLRYFFGTIALTAMLIWPTSIEEPLRNGGNFDPIRYRDWDYPENARNIQEEYHGNSAGDSGDPGNRYNTRDPNTEQEVLPGVGDDGAGPSGTNSSTRPAGLDSSPGFRQPIIADGVWDRRILPAHLCFKDKNDSDPKGYICRPVPNLVGDNTSQDFEYDFISYSRKQFLTQGEDEIQSWKQGDELKGNSWSHNFEQSLRDQIHIDRGYLTRIALKAAADSGLNAFYIDFECVDSAIIEQKEKGMNGEAKQLLPDVYRICDAMRAAKKMVLILGPRNQEIFERGRPTGRVPRNDDEARRLWLQQWGSRLWTLPELLLAPPGKSIDIYYLPSTPNKEESIDITKFREQTRVEVPHDNRGKRIFGVGKDSWTKAAFTSRAYETKQDATDIASLVDHFEGTLVLPTLELITHAAQALWRRKKSTFKFLNGDCSYALMGLLRRRPPVKASDEDFEAFARLSLANDSDQLLERLICLLPHRRSAPWYEWKDAWKKVNLWDIEPIIQVAAIADNSTVVLDGAYGATIRWRKLHPVAFSKRKTAWREVVKWGIRLGAAYFLTAVILVAQSPKPGNTTINNPYGPNTVISRPTSPLLIIGIIFLILTILVLIYSPWAMLKIYRGKVWSTQGWFFGIEGCADIGQVEKCLFAGNHHRLKWSTNGSMLSRHHLGRLHNENGRECLPEEPVATSWTRGQFEAARVDRGGIERLYTLIDTSSMEATLFWAEVPPTAVFICGSEGGMKRAMLCSFDWKTNSFVRETVVHMKTMVIDKMSRVERFRFALSRKDTFQVEETH